MLILGVNVLFIFAIIVAAMWSGDARSSKHACCRCGEPEASYWIHNVEGRFCKHCFYDAVENLWFAKAASLESDRNGDGVGASGQEAKE